MASYLDNKHSPTVKSLEKLNFVVSPEDKTNTQHGNYKNGDVGGKKLRKMKEIL